MESNMPMATTTPAASSSKATTDRKDPTSTTQKRKSNTTTKKSTKSRVKKKSSTAKHKSGRGTKGGGGNAATASTATAPMSEATLNRNLKNLNDEIQQEKDATFHDTAWLSNIPSSYQKNHHPLNTYSPSFLEQDLHIAQNALKANGLSSSNITAQAFGCLLESARKFALELIDDATEYAMLSSIEEITPADLNFAQQEQKKDSRVSCCSVEHLDLLTQIADDTNRSILPPIPDGCYNGVVLPSPEYNLLGRTFDVVNRSIVIESARNGGIGNGLLQDNKLKGVHDQGVSSTTGNEVMDANVQRNKIKSAPSHGARQGTQIPIKLTTHEEGSEKT